MKPAVGQQVTLEADVQNAGTDARIALLEARASAGDCDLVVKSRVGEREKGFLYQNGSFVSDETREPARTEAEMRGLLGDCTEALTFTCVPPGSGWRIGVDRDADGYADGDEIAAGSNPTSANSHP